MNKKMFRSIFTISLGGVGIWLLGFSLIWILDFRNAAAVNKTWFIIMLAGTVLYSVVKNMKDVKEDER